MLVITVLAVAACAAAALAVTGTWSAHAQRAAAPATAFAAGAFTQSNSRDGSAILGASAMRPGDVVSGDVTITNTGDLAGVFHLGASIVTEQAGTGGGQLRDRLLLQIFDITNPAAVATLFSGPLGAFSGRDLGTFQPHEGHSYRVTASFPDAGPGGDNAFAGASASVRFAWTAAADSPVPTPTAQFLGPDARGDHHALGGQRMRAARRHPARKARLEEAEAQGERLRQGAPDRLLHREGARAAGQACAVRAALQGAAVDRRG